MHSIVAALFVVLLAVTGCSEIPKEAYFNRGSPETLLDVSSEVVNLQLSDMNSVSEVADWVNQDQPTRAELYCMDGDPVCMHAQQVLYQFDVPLLFVATADNMVTLVYERVLARDCENRFIDNTINPYNMNHPTFGCSMASNMVQMVTDKQQFISPALLDYADGAKVKQSMDGYNTANEREATKIDTDFETLFDTAQ